MVNKKNMTERIGKVPKYTLSERTGDARKFIEFMLVALRDARIR